MRAFSIAAMLLLAACGHVVPASLTGTPGPFDFKKPGCTAHLDTDDTKVEVRYLGSGGLYVRWRNEAILVGPQFSNPGLLSAQFGRAHFDEPRIRAAIRELGAVPVRAILVGHSHYDHIGDLPIVALEPNVEKARIYVNATGDKLLNAYPDLQSRATIMQAGDAFELSPSFRVHVLASAHAPQVCRWPFFPCVYGAGEVPRAWTTQWNENWLSSFLGGETFAFDIEVRDESGTRFRIYYNDASASTPAGQTTGDFDLAVLTLPQWNYVRDYPRDLLRVLHPKHVLVSHWDNFFRRDDEQYRYVPNLSNRSAAGFLRVVQAEVSGGWAPVNEVCGVKTERFTMAVPRSVLLFKGR
ncbi:MAG TPA: MBL fold metallo-hydrolase [Thermoanaerobaculia bacterium]